jgi:cytidylate kinase
MGTVVFPDAPLKIYLTASAEERARRRHKQLVGKGIRVSLHRLLADINERDKRDRERKTAPLKPAEDAVLIDTTDLDVASVFDRVLTIVLNSGLDRAVAATGG